MSAHRMSRHTSVSGVTAASLIAAHAAPRPATTHAAPTQDTVVLGPFLSAALSPVPAR